MINFYYVLDIKNYTMLQIRIGEIKTFNLKNKKIYTNKKEI